MKPELSVLNRRRKTNGIKRRKVAHGNPDITGTWGKGPAPSGAAERRAYSVLNNTTCVQYGRGKAENTVRDILSLAAILSSSAFLFSISALTQLLSSRTMSRKVQGS